MTCSGPGKQIPQAEAEFLINELEKLPHLLFASEVKNATAKNSANKSEQDCVGVRLSVCLKLSLIMDTSGLKQKLATHSVNMHCEQIATNGEHNWKTSSVQ